MTENVADVGTGSPALPQTDALGLKHYTGNLLEIPPAIILYGPAGAGKSTEMAKALNRCKWVVTSPTVLRPFASWMNNHKEEAKRLGLQMPSFTVIPKLNPSTREPIDPRPALEKIVNAFIKDIEAGKNSYEGLVFDEWTEMAFRIHEGIKVDKQFGKNNFARMDALKDIHYQMAEIPRMTGKALGLICHEMEPQFDGNEGSVTFGRLQYPGGPKMPIKSLTRDISAAMDVVLRIRIEENTMTKEVSRFYDTSVSQFWQCKIRADGIDNKEPLGLRNLLSKAGYTL